MNYWQVSTNRRIIFEYFSIFSKVKGIMMDGGKFFLIHVGIKVTHLWASNLPKKQGFVLSRQDLLVECPDERPKLRNSDGFST